MKLVFIFGPAAAGKLTIGQALRELTGLRLFHNHLVVDTLLEVFPFGSPSFVRLREQIWLSVFEAAAKDDISTIFTFAPEATVDPSFIDKTASTIRNAGGEVCFVKLDCPVDVIESRLSRPSRQPFLKIKSVAVFRDLREKHAYRFPDLPAGLTLDTSTMQPSESARKICEYFQISVLAEPPVVEHDPEA